MLWTTLPALASAVFLSWQAVAQTRYEPNTDRRSKTDYEYVMPRPNPQLCLDACLRSARCRSWTFFKHPDGKGADCRLGNQKQQPVANPCCISGTR
jgi:hypothetical protein